MGQTSDWAMDFGGDTSVADLDHGGRAPDGFHRVKLESVGEDEDGNKKLVFAITSAKGKGAKVTEKLSNPVLLDGDRAAGANKKAKFVATRLGLVSPEMMGKSGLIQWDKAEGREYVVKVETRAMQKKADGTGGGEFTGLAYSGIFPLDHPDIPPATRAELSLPPARPRTSGETAAAAPKTAPASKVDLDNLFGK